MWLGRYGIDAIIFSKTHHIFSVSTEIVGTHIGTVIPCRPPIAGYGRKSKHNDHLLPSVLKNNS